MKKNKIIVLLLAILLICFLFTGCNKLKGDVVIKVEGVKVHENMFIFFCNMLLNQDEFLASSLYIDEITLDDVKESGLNFAKEYFFRLNEAKKYGIKLTEDELKELKDQFNSDYEQYKKVDGKTLSRKEFYEYYYGLTEKQYTEFWTNWSIIEKYTVEIEKQIEITDEIKEKAYEEYYDYICTYNMTMLTLDIRDLSEEKAQERYDLAVQIKEELENGGDFASYVEKYCDDKALKESKGDIDYYPYFQYTYPEVHQKVIGMIDGEFAIAKTDETIYVMRLDSIDELEELSDSDILKEWAIVYESNRLIEELVESEKYSFEVNDKAYKKCDISKVANEAMIYWQSIWASEAK